MKVCVCRRKQKLCPVPLGSTGSVNHPFSGAKPSETRGGTAEMPDSVPRSAQGVRGTDLKRATHHSDRKGRTRCRVSSRCQQRHSGRTAETAMSNFHGGKSIESRSCLLGATGSRFRIANAGGSDVVPRLPLSRPGGIPSAAYLRSYRDPLGQAARHVCKQFSWITLECSGNCIELDHINPPLTALHIGYPRLNLAEAASQFQLRNTSLLASRNQRPQEVSICVREDGLRHPASRS